MAQKQKHRAPKQKAFQRVCQEGTSSVMPEAISLYKENQAVEEKQSYAMVTGLLQVLVASIAYQRHLFPKSCFEMRLPSSMYTEAHSAYEQADARSTIASGDNEMAQFATALAQRGQRFMVLAPGKTNGADKLLAWLDEIFKGVLDRSLDGFRFSIFADKSRPSEILELYTCSFQYRIGNDGERQLVELTTPGGGSGIITTGSFRSGMVSMIDQLNNCLQQLPVLPKERYLMCHLFHSPSAPRHHRPPGFHTCTDTNMAVIDNGLWYMKQRSFEPIDSGIYRIRLETGLMARTDAAEDVNHRSMLAQNTQYTRTVSRTLTSDLKRRFEDHATLPVSTGMIKRPGRGSTQADELGDSMRLELLQGTTEDSGRTTRAVRRSPESLSMDLGESVRIHDTLGGDSLLPTQVMEAHDPPAVPSWKWKLRAGKKLEMGVKRDKQQWVAARADRVVRCECSCNQMELPMLQCICCQRLQHYHCYGFALETKVQEHHCYQCLFEDTQETLLSDMKSIAIFRRALWILYERTPSSPAEFAQKLNFDGKTTQGLIKRLDEGGYLASGRTRLSPVTTPEQSKTRSQLYHNPLTSIGRFYELGENTPLVNTDSEDENPRCKRRKT